MVTERIISENFKEYTITDGGITVVLLNRGGTVKNIFVKDKNGVLQDVVLGYDTPEEYADDFTFLCYGALVGRYANRIINAEFELNGKKYCLEKNNGEHHLHGSFTYRYLDSRIVDDNSVEMTLVSSPEEEGYPGELTLTLTYTLRDGGLIIDYKAVSTEDTVVNVTNHSYFNLNGQKGEGIENHSLTLNADAFTSLTPQRILTGEIVKVEGTSFDFRKGARLGEAMAGDDEQMAIFHSLDHNFILSEKEGMKHAATLYSDTTGISMEVYTTEPAVQVYVKAEYLKEKITGEKNRIHTAVCVEAQHYPSSVTFPDFPSTVLKKGDTYRQTTEYRFSVK